MFPRTQQLVPPLTCSDTELDSTIPMLDTGTVINFALPMLELLSRLLPLLLPQLLTVLPAKKLSEHNYKPLAFHVQELSDMDKLEISMEPHS